MEYHRFGGVCFPMCSSLALWPEHHRARGCCDLMILTEEKVF